MSFSAACKIMKMWAMRKGNARYSTGVFVVCLFLVLFLFYFSLVYFVSAFQQRTQKPRGLISYFVSMVDKNNLSKWALKRGQLVFWQSQRRTTSDGAVSEDPISRHVTRPCLISIIGNFWLFVKCYLPMISSVMLMHMSSHE